VSAPFERAACDSVAPQERVRPLRDTLLIEPLDWQPSTCVEVVREGRPVRGRVIATGPGAYAKRYLTNREGQRCGYKDTHTFIPTEVKPGDIVELGGLNIFDGKGYQFQEILVDGKLHLLCSEKDVCGIRQG